MQDVHQDFQGVPVTLPLRKERIRRIARTANAPAVTGGLTPWQISRVLHYVENNLSICISVAKMAAHAKLSESHFSRAFQLTFHDSPYNYVLRQRLNISQILMLCTDSSLSEIALEIGMVDQAHFSNTFKRFYGVTPKVWREQMMGRRRFPGPDRRSADKAVPADGNDLGRLG